MSFITNFFKNKAGNAVQALNEFLVKLDPATAKQADLDTLNDLLVKASLEMVTEEKNWIREQKEADSIVALYRQRKSAAEIIQNNLDTMTAEDPRRAATEASLDNQLKVLKDMLPDVQREKQEAEDAKVYYEDIKAFVEETAATLKDAKQRLDAAEKKMKQSERDVARAEERTNRTEMLTGIKKQRSNLAVALTAMEEIADKNDTKAKAANARTTLLMPAKAPEEDPIIAAAMAQAAGAPAPAASAKDRLAELPQL
jgi:hypothetical protein